MRKHLAAGIILIIVVSMLSDRASDDWYSGRGSDEMDSSDLLSVQGITCAFEQYELYRDGEWETVFNCVPFIASL